jgi:cyclopropane-fatty-acyl-phospholipid synthase
VSVELLPGASAAAVRSHYDAGNEFYALWLDERTTSYTAALYEDSLDEDLGLAQERKLDLHATNASVQGAERVLDIGCGWGNLITHMVSRHGVGRATGLTLSPKQAAWIAGRGDDRLEARVEHWFDHVPDAPYDAIFSIESLEAFVKPGLSREAKVRTYRDLFERCHAWTKPGGRMSFQFISYGNAFPEDLDSFISSEIFPESDLPTLSEIAEATERLFEIVSLRNDRDHYAATLRAWLARLKARRAEAVALVGEDVVKRYEQYLRLCIYMFVSGGCDLHRVAFRRIDRPRAKKESYP